MPLAGGAADKYGNRYENWWTVHQLFRLLRGEIHSLTIEEPSVDKAEYLIESSKNRELHQAKRSAPGNAWTLAGLRSEDSALLPSIFKQLDGNTDLFVFVSGDSAKDLEELSSRARGAGSSDRFLKLFLTSQPLNENYQKIKKDWGDASDERCFDVLRRVEVRHLDERSQKEWARDAAAALFRDDPMRVVDALRSVVQDSVHEKLTQESLKEKIFVRGYKLREFPTPQDASALVSEATQMYLEELERKLILSCFAPRKATDELMQRLLANGAGGDWIMTGKAGAGKSACCLEIVRKLKALPDAPVVLAFRLDRIGEVLTTRQLGEQIGLGDSPAVVLAAAAGRRRAVLLLDQLDAISTTSGRNPQIQPILEEVLREVRGLRHQLMLDVVLVCRRFDWENDAQLRQLHSIARGSEEIDRSASVQVEDLAEEQIKGILTQSGFDPKDFHRRQIEILKVPQNLSVFLEGAPTPGTSQEFTTERELFDRYWDAKRRAVETRVATGDDLWFDVIQRLCTTMSERQQLFTAREMLDKFPQSYLNRMVSEGVLFEDRGKFGFGHESFFDYCFARLFIHRGSSLADLLLASSEQQLFRRAQVRQVLSYLREGDLDRYLRELRQILEHERVRFHLKDVALAVAFAVPSPTDAEWQLIEQWISAQMQCFADGDTSKDLLVASAWRHFFTSTCWFRYAYKRGLIVDWLKSEKNGIVDNAVNYLRFQQRENADEVAGLLEPYIGQPGRWKDRLRSLMEWADIESSRQLFDLFLRLIDDGTLDEARGPITVNSEFWSMLHGLSEQRPDWLVEVIAHWIRRRMEIVRSSEQPAWGNVLDDDRFASTTIQGSGAKASDAWITHILPVVLDLSDAALTEMDGEKPIGDAVWPFFMNARHFSLSETIIDELAGALEAQSLSAPQVLREIFFDLSKRETVVANFLLLNLVAGSPKLFASEASKRFTAEPWRFSSGYTDSPYWMAMQVIERIVPELSAEERRLLEHSILGFKPRYERSRDGFTNSGRASFCLLSKFPPDYRSSSAQARFEELERKFKYPYSAPKGFQGGFVGSPINKEAAKKMSDEQWLRAISKYSTDNRSHTWDDDGFWKGGAHELANQLKDFVKEDPSRFADLLLRFPDGTNLAYYQRVLDGLAETEADNETKLRVCRTVFELHPIECGNALAAALGSLNPPLDSCAAKMLTWLATEHPSPGTEDRDEDGENTSHDDRLLTVGLNTVRGRAVWAIRDLSNRSGATISMFEEALPHLFSDPSVAVRACAVLLVLPIFREDRKRAVDLLIEVLATDDRLLEVADAVTVIQHSLRTDFQRLRPIVEKMLTSSVPHVAQSGGVLSALAELCHPEEARDLVGAAISQGTKQRAGVAKVAAVNVVVPQVKEWCLDHLVELFHDSEAEVRREAAQCFRKLKSESLTQYERLIGAFIESPAFADDSHGILDLLEQSQRQLPTLTLEVCERFLDRFGQEVRDNRTSRSMGVPAVSTLIFRTYHQYQCTEIGRHALDLIDRLCAEGIQDIYRRLEDYER